MSNALQTTPQLASADLLPGQRRYTTLLGQIERAQKRLDDWRAQQSALDHWHTMVVLPLQNEFTTLQRKWIFALDRIAHWADWSDTESSTLRQLLCQAGLELLLRNAQDAEIHALYARYADTDFASQRARMVHIVTGGAATDAASSRPDTKPTPEAADTTRLSKKQIAARMLAQIRREQEALHLAHAARDLFRKLASDLHPDREPDAALRATKNSLMQQVNQAYAHNDVFALLRLQAQADAHGIAQTQGLVPERIRYFNRLLSEQLASLKSQIALLEADVLGRLSLPASTRCSPQRCEALVKQSVRRWRQRRTQLQDQLQRIGTQAEAKRLLQQARQAQVQQVVQRLVAQAVG